MNTLSETNFADYIDFGQIARDRSLIYDHTGESTGDTTQNLVIRIDNVDDTNAPYYSHEGVEFTLGDLEDTLATHTGDFPHKHTVISGELSPYSLFLGVSFDETPSGVTTDHALNVYYPVFVSTLHEVGI